MIIKFVIPNRAESPVRNLLSADTTTKEAAPFFAHFAKSGIPQPHPSEDSEAPRPGRARLQPCRKPIINFVIPNRAESPVRNLL
jgi:hypothetical protein